MCLLRDNVQCYTSTSAGPGETELGKYTPVQSRAAPLMEASYRGQYRQLRRDGGRALGTRSHNTSGLFQKTENICPAVVTSAVSLHLCQHVSLLTRQCTVLTTVQPSSNCTTTTISVDFFRG